MECFTTLTSWHQHGGNQILDGNQLQQQIFPHEHVAGSAVWDEDGRSKKQPKVLSDTDVWQ